MRSIYAPITLVLLNGVLAGCTTPSQNSSVATPAPATVETSAQAAATQATAAAQTAVQAAAQATAAAAAVAASNRNSGSNGRGNTPSPEASIVRYIGWDTSHWPKGLSANKIAGFYTRLEIYSKADNGGGGGSGSDAPLRNYDQENRGWLARLLQSETNTVTTLANVEIRDPALKIAVPLFSITHASGRDLGNTWVTNFTQSNVESPLFRVGANTAIVVHLKAQASQDLKSQAAATTIGAVTQAVRIASPASTLLTTLSGSQISNTATAIDTTISKLFSSDKTEDIELGRFADSWGPDNQLVLTGCAPFVRIDGALTGHECSGLQDKASTDIKVGQWTLALRCPQISIFDPENICKVEKDGDNTKIVIKTNEEITAAKTAIAETVKNGAILNFPLSNQVTIQGFVQNQAWYTAFISKGDKAESDDFVNFCANVTTGASSLSVSGLNDFDAALALRAIVHQLPGVVQYGDKFEKNLGCIRILGQQNDVKL